MQIGYDIGQKADKDRKIWIKTTYPDGNWTIKEYFSIFKLALLINQIGINEQKIWGDMAKFKRAIFEVLAYTLDNKDWADQNNIDLVKGWCNRNHLGFEKVEPELRRIIQKKVMDYAKK